MPFTYTREGWEHTEVPVRLRRRLGEYPLSYVCCTPAGEVPRTSTSVCSQPSRVYLTTVTSVLVTVVAAGVCTRVVGADMQADSPVTFPEEGALPARFPPDRPSTASETPEEGYYLFTTPERSLEQIAKIQAEMPQGSFALPKADWSVLSRTRRILTEGGELRLLALGDSMVNDTMRSAWVAKLGEAYPKATLEAWVYVRGGGGCQHYREENRIARYVLPRKPTLVFIGGISQGGGIEDIREVIRQLRAGLPEVEVLLATGTFGSLADPRAPRELAKAPYSGTSDYGARLRELAAQEHCAYLDMTTPWAEYLRSSGMHPPRFYRDRVHANEYGEQILSKILLSFLGP